MPRIFATLLLALALWPLMAVGAFSQGGYGTTRPNIVLIVADDLGFSDLGCYGSEIFTPHIDRLAKDGVRFTQFYNCGRGCPSRAALLTGLYPHETGMGHMTTDYRRPGYRGNLNKECATLAELLGKASYQTLMCGKWHLTPHIGPQGPKHTWPLQRGFEKFYGTIHGAGSYFDPATLTRDNQFTRRPPGEYYYTDAISEQAAGFIEQASRAGKPFFLYVAYTAPHWPLHAPEQAVSRYEPTYAAGWDQIRMDRFKRMRGLGILDAQCSLSPRDPRVRPWSQNSYKRWQQRRMAVYAAQVALLDQGVGRIVEKLGQVGAEQNTLVMFLSDNGGCAEEVADTWKGDHIPRKTYAGSFVQVGNSPSVMPGPEDTYQSYGLAWANVSNTPFKLYKHFAHEGGIATPLVVRWPADIRSTGQRVREVGHVIDIVPTCLELAKMPYPSIFNGYNLRPLSGESLVPVLRGQGRRGTTYFWEHEGNRAVREGKWKLVASCGNAWELYNMEADRTEMNNLARQYPAMVETLEKLYNAWAKRTNVEPWRQ